MQNNDPDEEQADKKLSAESGQISGGRTVESRPFQVKSKNIGLPDAWTSGCVSELIEMLEGPLHR